MRSIKCLALVALFIVSVCSADKGLTISNQTVPGNWQVTQTASETSKVYWTASSGQSYLSGFFGATSVGGWNYAGSSTSVFGYNWDVYSTGAVSSIATWRLPTTERAGKGPTSFSTAGVATFAGYGLQLVSFISGSAPSWQSVTRNVTWWSSSSNMFIMDIYAVSQTSSQWPKIVTILLASTNSPNAAYAIRATQSSAGASITTPDSDHETLSTSSRCFRIFLDTTPSPKKYIVTCSGQIIAAEQVGSGNDRSGGMSFYASQRKSWPLGVGDYTTGLILPEMRRLYLGSSIGLAFEVDLDNNYALLRVTLLSVGGNLSPFTSALYEKPFGSQGVIYWGSSDGYMARVNLRDFQVFSQASLAEEGKMDVSNPLVATNLYVTLPGTSSSPANSLYALGSGPIDQGTSSNANNFRSYKVTKYDCSAYSCTQCNSNPVDIDYCGWCVNTGTCTAKGECANPSPWVQGGTCPVPVSIEPSRGSVTGGTSVIYTGTYFELDGSGTPTGYACKWGSISGTTPANPIPGSLTKLACISPSGLPAGVTILSILYTPPGGTQRPYSDGLAFTAYNCAQLASTCTSCQLLTIGNTYQECSWCMNSGSCVSRNACSGPLGAFNPQVCPTTTTVGPKDAQTSSPVDIALADANAGTQSVSINAQNWVSAIPANSFQCDFYPVDTADPVPHYYGAASYYSTSGRINCAIPNTVTASADTQYFVQVVESAASKRVLIPGPATGLTIYNCDGIEACYSCNRYAKCTWCSNPSDPSETQCIVNTATCPFGTASAGGESGCSQVDSYTPYEASLSQITASFRIQMTGRLLDSPGAALVDCYFIKGSTTLKTQMEGTTATSTLCPVPSSITAGNWSVSLGNSATRQTQSYPFFIYDCTAYATCGECITPEHPLCDWCIDIDNGGSPATGGGNAGCSDSTHSATCSTEGWLSARGMCPLASSASPTALPLTGGATITVMGPNLMIGENNATQVSCLFISELNGTAEIIGPVESGNWDSSVSGVNCNVVTAAPSFKGPALVYLVATSNPTQVYSPGVPFNFVTCSDFTDCDSCMAGESFCRWCGATCTENCEMPEFQASTCPRVSFVEPAYSATAGGEPITIHGVGFLPGITIPPPTIDTPIDETPIDEGFPPTELNPTDGVKKSQISLSSGLFNPNAYSPEVSDMIQSLIEGYSSYSSYKVDSEANKREISAISASPYTCDFGGVQAPAQVSEDGTKIICTSPAKTSEGESVLNVLFNGNVYITTPGIEYFTCDTSEQSTCTTICTAKDYCGWCVSEMKCTSQTQCRTSENVLSPVWQRSVGCPTISLNRNQYPTAGNLLATATITEELPRTVLRRDLQCTFDGSVIVNATSFSWSSRLDQATNTTINMTSISCPTPATTSARTSSFAVTYKRNALTPSTEFVYADCSIYKDCTRCISVPFCGWCSVGNKCLMDVQCTGNGGRNWLRNKCPINKVALGVGLGIGLFALLLLVLVFLFLLKRYRRKDGLVIAVKEPNYFEIAWGADTTLWWKIPSDYQSYSVLERMLHRKDFLLQVAISFNCPATEQDALAKAMVYVASAHGFAAELIQTLVRYEVQTCQTENTLFRNNSVASKMYKFFSRIVGIKYLFNCIARVVMELEVLGRKQIASTGASGGQTNGVSGSKSSRADEPDVSLLNMTMELDQTKALGDDIDTDTNLLQLQLICQKVLHVLIKSSVRNIPSDFRKIFIEIDNSVMQRFPESQDAVYKGIGGFFFLRFVCPALTAPHVYGLLESPPNPVTQRQLVLITKVIQNIANMQEPGKKEEYMAALGQFIVRSIPKIVVFYDNLRVASNLAENADAASTDAQQMTVPDEVTKNGLAIIANFLHTQTPKIKTWAQSEECPFDDMTKNELEEMLDEAERTYPKAPKKLTQGAESATATLERTASKKKIKKQK